MLPIVINCEYRNDITAWATCPKSLATVGQMFDKA